jgi:hypothetical protein
MMGKLNDKYQIICFTNTVFNAALLCTISVLQFLLFPQLKQERKDIIKLQPLGHCEMQNM